ncbi:MAG TPA: hypothetical protein VGQ76_24370 [Thermoanaerobaculia bacterium]|nr:hypothetical protein [Thermoanaerobaculia bacterium]
MPYVRLATAALFLIITVGATAQNKVAVMAAASPAPWLEDVRAKLEATGMFDEVDSYNLYTQMSPTLAQMQEYCSILVFTDYAILDGVTFGNNLADYVDGGGGVVAATFATASVPISGRFATDNYYGLQPNTHITGPTETLGTIHNSCHPVLHDVMTFNGGISSYRQTTDSLHPQAVRIAD